MRVKARIIAVAAAIALVALAAVPAQAQEGAGSPALVKQLVSAMQARQLDVIAAPDPADPGRLVAAMMFPEVQMLVMSTRHKPSPYLQDQLAKHQFRTVYEELQRGLPEGRLFFHDLGCDGFVGGDYVDILYEGERQKTMFDGNWMAQSMTEEAYVAKQKDAEAKYVHALQVLLDAAKKLPIKT